MELLQEPISNLVRAWEQDEAELDTLTRSVRDAERQFADLTARLQVAQTNTARLQNLRALLASVVNEPEPPVGDGRGTFYWGVIPMPAEGAPAPGTTITLNPPHRPDDAEACLAHLPEETPAEDAAPGGGEVQAPEEAPPASGGEAEVAPPAPTPERTEDTFSHVTPPAPAPALTNVERVRQVLRAATEGETFTLKDLITASGVSTSGVSAAVARLMTEKALHLVRRNAHGEPGLYRRGAAPEGHVVPPPPSAVLPAEDVRAALEANPALSLRTSEWQRRVPAWHPHTHTLLDAALTRAATAGLIGSRRQQGLTYYHARSWTDTPGAPTGVTVNRPAPTPLPDGMSADSLQGRVLLFLAQHPQGETPDRIGKLALGLDKTAALNVLKGLQELRLVAELPGMVQRFKRTA